MVAKYEFRDKTPQQIEQNRQEKQFIIECFNSFMEDLFGKHHHTDGSEEQCKFHRDDMRRAFVNGWSSGVYHIKR